MSETCIPGLDFRSECEECNERLRHICHTCGGEGEHLPHCLRDEVAKVTAERDEARKLLKAAVDGFDSAMAMLKQDAAAKARLEAEVLRLMTELEETRKAKYGGLGEPGAVVIWAGGDPFCDHEHMPYDSKRNENVCLRCGFGR